MKTTCFNFQKLYKFKLQIKLKIHEVLTLQGLTLFFPLKVNSVKVIRQGLNSCLNQL